jgi:transglutaminase-like putative cysteine protease
VSLAFGRDKRRLLGWLTLAAPWPLPFNELLPWPALLLFELVVAAFLVRVRRDPAPSLRTWAANLLGLAYLPLLWLDFVAFSGGRIVGPLVRLILFALAVKLFRLRTEGDKWQAFGGAFIVFLAAMGTSVHPTIVLYLVGFLALALLVLARFAHFGVLADLGHRDRDPAPVPVRWRGVIGWMTAASAILAIPLFAVLPRSRAPFIAGRGSPASANVVSVASFSDEVTLDSIGRQRGNRGIALRVAYDPPLDQRLDEPRFKGGAFDHFDGRAWHRPPAATDPPFSRSFDGWHSVGRGGGPTTRRATVWRQVLDSSALPLPVETVRFRAGVFPGLQFDVGGVPRLAVRPHDTLSYEAELGATPRSGAVPPAPSLLDPGPLSPEIVALARGVIGDATAAEQKIARLERYLLDNYAYSLEFLATPPERPMEEFLLRSRRGHCEYFATALVLLLRAEGVPARLVTGFLGGEVNPIDGHLVVRQDNAHAWVEAWVDGRGWLTSDPTPDAGRPSVAAPGLGRLAGQLWDFVLFRWDRYVLTYGAADQRDFLLRSFDRLWRWWRGVRGARPSAAPADAPAPPEESATGVAPSPPPMRLTGPAVAVAALAAAALAAFALRRRRNLSAQRAYRVLCDAVTATLRPPRRALGPLALAEQVGGLAPSLAAPSRRIVDAYLAESFAAGGVAVAALDRDLKRVRQELRRLARARRAPGRKG